MLLLKCARKLVLKPWRYSWLRKKLALSFRSFTDQRRQDFFQSRISFQFRERSEGLQCRPFVTYFPYGPIPVKLDIIKLFAKSGKSIKRHFLFECQCIKSAFLLTSLTKVALSFRSFTDQRRQDFFQSCISFQFREIKEAKGYSDAIDLGRLRIRLITLLLLIFPTGQYLLNLTL